MFDKEGLHWVSLKEVPLNKMHSSLNFKWHAQLPTMTVLQPQKVGDNYIDVLFGTLCVFCQLNQF